MILAEEALQTAIYDALAGQISYNAAPVDIFDEIAALGAGFPRVIIQAISNGPQEGSKDSFRSECSVLLKVSTAFFQDVTKTINDSIANQIASILIPSPKGPFLNVEGFSVLLVQLAGTSSQSYQDQFQKYLDKNIRIQFTLEQKSLQ